MHRFDGPETPFAALFAALRDAALIIGLGLVAFSAFADIEFERPFTAQSSTVVYVDPSDDAAAVMNANMANDVTFAFLAGTHEITADVELAKRVHLVGESKDTTFLTADATSEFLVDTALDTAGDVQITVKDVTAGMLGTYDAAIYIDSPGASAPDMTFVIDDVASPNGSPVIGVSAGVFNSLDVYGYDSGLGNSGPVAVFDTRVVDFDIDVYASDFEVEGNAYSGQWRLSITNGVIVNTAPYLFPGAAIAVGDTEIETGTVNPPSGSNSFVRLYQVSNIVESVSNNLTADYQALVVAVSNHNYGATVTLSNYVDFADVLLSNNVWSALYAQSNDLTAVIAATSNNLSTLVGGGTGDLSNNVWSAAVVLSNNVWAAAATQSNNLEAIVASASNGVQAVSLAADAALSNNVWSAAATQSNNLAAVVVVASNNLTTARLASEVDLSNNLESVSLAMSNNLWVALASKNVALSNYVGVQDVALSNNMWSAMTAESNALITAINVSSNYLEASIVSASNHVEASVLAQSNYAESAYFLIDDDTRGGDIFMGTHRVSRSVASTGLTFGASGQVGVGLELGSFYSTAVGQTLEVFGGLLLHDLVSGNGKVNHVLTSSDDTLLLQRATGLEAPLLALNSATLIAIWNGIQHRDIAAGTGADHAINLGQLSAASNHNYTATLVASNMLEALAYSVSNYNYITTLVSSNYLEEGLLAASNYLEAATLVNSNYQYAYSTSISNSLYGIDLAISNQFQDITDALVVGVPGTNGLSQVLAINAVMDADIETSGNRLIKGNTATQRFGVLSAPLTTDGASVFLGGTNYYDPVYRSKVRVALPDVANSEFVVGTFAGADRFSVSEDGGVDMHGYAISDVSAIYLPDAGGVIQSGEPEGGVLLLTGGDLTEGPSLWVSGTNYPVSAYRSKAIVTLPSVDDAAFIVADFTGTAPKFTVNESGLVNFHGHNASNVADGARYTHAATYGQLTNLVAVTSNGLDGAFYPIDNPSNYVDQVALDALSNSIPTAGAITTLSNNTWAAAVVQSNNLEAMILAASNNLDAASGALSNNIAATFYPRSNPSNYITLAEVPGGGGGQSNTLGSVAANGNVLSNTIVAVEGGGFFTGTNTADHLLGMLAGNTTPLGAGFFVAGTNYSVPAYRSKFLVTLPSVDDASFRVADFTGTAPKFTVNESGLVDLHGNSLTNIGILRQQFQTEIGAGSSQTAPANCDAVHVSSSEVNDGVYISAKSNPLLCLGSSNNQDLAEIQGLDSVNGFRVKVDGLEGFELANTGGEVRGRLRAPQQFVSSIKGTVKILAEINKDAGTNGTFFVQNFDGTDTFSVDSAGTDVHGLPLQNVASATTATNAPNWGQVQDYVSQEIGATTIPTNYTSIPVTVFASAGNDPVTVYSGFWESFEFIDTSEKSCWLTVGIPEDADLAQPMHLHFLWKENTAGGATTSVVHRMEFRFYGNGGQSDQAIDYTIKGTNLTQNVQHYVHALEVPINTSFIDEGDVMSIVISREVGSASDNWSGHVGLNRNLQLDYIKKSAN